MAKSKRSNESTTWEAILYDKKLQAELDSLPQDEESFAPENETVYSLADEEEPFHRDRGYYEDGWMYDWEYEDMV